MSAPALSVDGLTVVFDDTRAVDRLTVAAHPGKVLALIGESGSGKSTALAAIAGLLPKGARAAGAVHIAGEAGNVLRTRREHLAGRHIGMVFQNPGGSLNPVLSVGDQLGEVVRIHHRTKRSQTVERVEALLDQVGLPRTGPQAKDWSRAFPHQLSGGQKQRVAIAAALAGDPAVLLADEPTTALDATVQAQIIDLLLSLVDARHLALVFVTHDLPLAAAISDTMAVMKDGRLVETGEARSLVAKPAAAYTRALVDASLPFTRGATPPATPDHSADIVMRLDGIEKTFRARGGTNVAAVRGVSLAVQAGEILGLIGESGSGKTTLGRIGAGLLVPDTGDVLLEGTAFQPKHQRSAVQMVFQDPLASFNPRQTIGEALSHPLRCLGRADRQDRARRTEELLTNVGLDPALSARRPHTLSGGQLQRAAIARALAAEPKVLVCDEAVASLDVSIRAQILALLRKLRREAGLSVLFISHDLGVVQAIADRVVVLRSGAVVEEGIAHSVLTHPTHDYTKALLASVPAADMPWRFARAKPVA